MTRPHSPPIDMLRFEREARERGAVWMCGIDEVGRGPLAGPVVAAAVILPPDLELTGLTDSKKLSPRKREEFYETLTSCSGARWAIASIDAEEIDRINILQATWKAMVQARAALDPSPDWTLVDGLRVPPLGEAQTAIVGGDALSLSIAAASVLAKVTRDRCMVDMERQYPGYGFSSHKGYGTQAHLEALQMLGPSPIHRRSFKPVQWVANLKGAGHFG